jgi:uncharacterized protein YceK
MRRLFILLAALLSACSQVSQHKAVGDQGYFNDAAQCYQTAERTESTMIPTAGGRGQIEMEIPMGYDASEFMDCMSYAGRPVTPNVNPNVYLQTSSTCINQSRSADNPDAAFADCIERSRLKVEVIDEK